MAESLTTIIDKRVREMLEEMAALPPNQRESIAGAIQKLLQAKPLAGDGNMDLFHLLTSLDKGPRPANGDRPAEAERQET